MTAPTRIYIVTPKIVEDGKPVAKRLVRAPTPAQALRHVASEFDVAVASQDDLVAAVADGVRVEDAGAKGAAS